MRPILQVKELIAITAVIIITLGITTISCADTKMPDTKMVIFDDAKRRVEVPAKPKRIVVLNSSNLELLYAVGGKAIGRPESTGMPKELFQKVKNLPSVGETPNPNIEKIVSLNPDLVIGVNVAFHHAIIPALERAKIPILLLSMNSYKDILDKLEIYGRLTGNHEKALSLIAGIKKKKADIQRYAQNYANKYGKTNVAIIWGSTQSFNMALPTSFVGNLVEMLGGINIAVDSKPLASMPRFAPLSMEYVLSKDPDMIFLITHGYEAKVAEKFKKEVESHPAWKGLRAVRNGKLYQLPYSLFGVNPAIRVTEAIEHIARLMYPGIPGNI